MTPVVWKTITLASDFTYSESSRSNRIRMGMQRAQKRGVKLGRPRLIVNKRKIRKLAHKMSIREIAIHLGCSKSYVQKTLASIFSPYRTSSCSSPAAAAIANSSSRPA